jgi:hypothetical protein
MSKHRWQHLHFYLLLLLLPACSGPRHRVERDLEEGVPRVRTLGAPRHRGAPFRLVREQVFGDPALGVEGTLTQPRGYLEVPGGLAVFDDGDHALKVYEDDGRLRFRMGRRGQASFVNISKPFWPFFSWWVQGSQIAVCRGTAFRVELFNLQGQRRRILEWDAPLSTVTDSMWAATRRTILRDYGTYGPTVWAALEQPEKVPSVEGVRLDDAGRIWTLRYRPSERYGGPADPNLYWDVLDADGTWLGLQPTPGVARYFGREVCYVTEDTEGGSVVVRYRLEPAGSNPDRSSAR